VLCHSLGPGSSLRYDRETWALVIEHLLVALGAAFGLGDDVGGEFVAGERRRDAAGIEIVFGDEGAERA